MRKDCTVAVALVSATSYACAGHPRSNGAPGADGSNGSSSDSGVSSSGSIGGPSPGGSGLSDGDAAALSLDGGGIAPVSCLAAGPGRTDCGPGGSGIESCCTSLDVTGGTYYRTYTYADTALSADPAIVSGFRLDKYLVTVGRFRQFVSAWKGGYTPPAGSGKHAHLNGGSGLNAGAGAGYEPGWLATDSGNIAPTDANLSSCSPYGTWTPWAGMQESLPINCVIWFEAYAFCIWDGGFLPSEAEWEYAAAGGSQQRQYPWGAIDPGTTDQYAVDNCNYPSESGACANAANIAPVGAAALGAGLWGQLDLAGELWEWTVDWYAPYPDPCVDCADTAPRSFRVFRGGDFSIDASYLLPPYRYYAPPVYRNHVSGFRCARAP